MVFVQVDFSFLRRLCSLLIVTTVSLCVYSQKISFERINIDNGLADNFPTDVVMDKYGYLWIGSSSGLNRYDGTSCKVYTSTGKTGIKIRNLNQLLIDKDQKLWICSHHNGLFVYDIEKDSFANISFSDKDAFVQKEKNSIRLIVQTINSDLWAISPQGVVRYMHHKKQWKWYTHSLENIVFNENNPFSLVQSPDSVLYMGTQNRGEIFYYDKSKDAFRIMSGNSPNITHSINSLFVDYKGNFWFGSKDEGLVFLDKHTGQRTHFKAHPSVDSLHSNEIASIFEDSEHTIWIGTVNGGLSRFNRDTKSFITYTNNILDASSIASNSASVSFEDADNNLYICSNEGLNILNRRNNLFNTIAMSTEGNKVIAHNKVKHFYEDTDGIIWMGTDGDGLQKYNPKTGLFKSYTKNNGLSSNAVLDIEPNGDGRLWLSTWGGGIMLFDPKTGSSKNYTTSNSKIASLNIKGIQKDGDFLWIGTHGKGVTILDCKTNIFYSNSKPSPKFNFDMGKPAWINDILKDSHGNFWIYCTDGLFRYDGKRMKEYIINPKDSTSLQSLFVSCMYEDSKGNIWVGEQGLSLYNRSKDCFTNLNRHLKNMPRTVSSIVEANNGTLWLGSCDGIYNFDYHTNTVKRFTRTDGLINNQFSDRAVLLSRGGLLYFGGNKCINIFDPTTVNNIKVKLPNVHISSCKTLTPENKFNPEIEFIYNDKIEIPYDLSKIIKLNYIVPTIQSKELFNFHVQLVGFDKEERNVVNETSVVYTNLQPRTYLFRVRAFNKSSGQFIGYSTVSFTILTPWYKSLTFKILLSLITLSIIFGVFYLRFRMVKRQNILLAAKVKERTEKLEQQYELIILKNNDLIQTIDTRDKLLALISHDLKNPVSALFGISSMLDLNWEAYREEKRKNIVKQIVSSSESIKDQVVNLLDWAMSQTQNISCSPQDCDTKAIVSDTIVFLSPLTSQKQISIELESNLSCTTLVDPVMYSTIVRNILHNSIKFSNKNSVISVKLYSDDGHTITEIRDSGVGMAADKIHDILNASHIVPSYGTEKEKGIGLGMRICREFIAKNNGILEITSAANIGTTLKLSLPIGNTTLSSAIENDISEFIEINRSHVHSTSEEKYRLLIVEDNVELANMLSLHLANSFDVDYAHDGNVGLKMAIETMPDIILTDLDMPEINGLELCEKLKANHDTNHIPILIISANTSEIVQQKGFNLGIDDYITKPFSTTILTLKLNNLLENRDKLAQNVRLKVMTEPVVEKALSSNEAFIEKTIKIIEENIHVEDLSVEFIAKEIGYSRQQFYRKFKAILNQSPVEFLISYKLNKAKLLIKSQRYSISEIAYSLGFNEPRYFTHCFKKEFGCTPSQFAQESKKEQL